MTGTLSLLYLYLSRSLSKKLSAVLISPRRTTQDRAYLLRCGWLGDVLVAAISALVFLAGEACEGCLHVYAQCRWWWCPSTKYGMGAPLQIVYGYILHSWIPQTQISDSGSTREYLIRSTETLGRFPLQACRMIHISATPSKQKIGKVSIPTPPCGVLSNSAVNSWLDSRLFSVLVRTTPADTTWEKGRSIPTEDNTSVEHRAGAACMIWLIDVDEVAWPVYEDSIVNDDQSSLGRQRGKITNGTVTCISVRTIFWPPDVVLSVGESCLNETDLPSCSSALWRVLEARWIDVSYALAADIVGD